MHLPTEIKTHVHTETYTEICMAAFFIYNLPKPEKLNVIRGINGKNKQKNQLQYILITD